MAQIPSGLTPAASLGSRLWHLGLQTPTSEAHTALSVSFPFFCQPESVFVASWPYFPSPHSKLPINQRPSSRPTSLAASKIHPRFPPKPDSVPLRGYQLAGGAPLGAGDLVLWVWSCHLVLITVLDIGYTSQQKTQHPKCSKIKSFLSDDMMPRVENFTP